MNKNILMLTNLKVWSMGKGVGAPSFYNTLKVYNDNGSKVTLLSTEASPPIDELENVECIKLPKLKCIKVPILYSVNRLMNYFLYQIIALYYIQKLNINKFDLLYAYEVEFVPVLSLISKFHRKPFVSRFQGTILAPLMNKKNWKLRFFPHYFSIKIKSDLTIMTDDGTKGDYVINSLRTGTSNVQFLKNGVDIKLISDDNGITSKLINNINFRLEKVTHKFISVSRLQSWKKVERSLDVFAKFLEKEPDSLYLLVGEGDTRDSLEEYARQLGVSESVIFTGGLPKNDVGYLLSKSNYFLSHYDLSNVGNPLWEAIANNCLVLTIDNGDTGKVIQDMQNGIMSEPVNYLNNADKLLLALENKSEKKLINAATITLNNNVTSWEERMQNELELVQKL